MSFVFDWDYYTRHLWQYAQMLDTQKLTAVHEAERNFDHWSEFTTDLFARLYQSDPVDLGEDSDAPAFYRDLHEHIGGLAEFRELRERTVGDEDFAAMATHVVAQDMYEESLAGVGPVRSSDGEADAIAMIEQMKQMAEADGDETDEFDEILDELAKSIVAKAQQNEEAREQLDDTLIRTRVARVFSEIKEQIDEQMSAVEAFGVPQAGTGTPLARADRNRAAKDLGSLLQRFPQMKEIIKHAGRLRREMRRAQRNKPNPHSADIAGVELGADLENILSDEFALLAAPETELMFLDRLAARSLQQVQITEKPKKEQGPVVLCIDCSYSMAGERAAWAAGVALAVFEAAMRQNRACCFIHFNEAVAGHRVFRPRDKLSMERLVDSVLFQPNGSTAFFPALEKAVETIRGTTPFQDADVLFITDGEASDSLAEIGRAKSQLGFSIYAIYVGVQRSSYELSKISDLNAHISSLLDDSPLRPIFEAV